MSEFGDELSGTSGAKLPLTDEGTDVVQRLGRWMRIAGTIQMAISGMFLLWLLLFTVGGAMSLGIVALLIMLIPVVAVGVWLVQGLRIQAAGEQLENLADSSEIDYLELAFVRLKTVFILDIVFGLAVAANGVFTS